MSKEQYNKLLQLMDEMCIEDYSGPPEDGDSIPIMELEPLPEYPFEPFFNELNIILESKIFRDGQFNVNRYKNFQINDFEEFIWLLCDKIQHFCPVDVDEIEEYFLLNLVKAIEECNRTIRRLFGKREESQITALKERIETWLKNVQKSSPQFLITERQLSEDITGIFKKYIPDAHEENISVGVSKVLDLFGITCKPKTITMREYRKRKSMSEK